MMLPSLISVSLAPVSYFFWASALPVVAARAMTAVDSATTSVFCFESITSPWVVFLRVVFLELAEPMLSEHSDLPRAVRHQEDDEEQEDPEHRAGQSLRDSLGDVRNE